LRQRPPPERIALVDPHREHQSLLARQFGRSHRTKILCGQDNVRESKIRLEGACCRFHPFYPSSLTLCAAPFPSLSRSRRSLCSCLFDSDKTLITSSCV